MSGYYPLFMRLSGKRCVIVGGGKVALRKAQSLLEASAAVRVISPEAEGSLAALAGEGRIEWIRDAYRGGEQLEGAVLVLAAAGDGNVNRRVCRDAAALGIPANNADLPEEGDFITPGVVRRGPLLIAVTTSGASPSAARQICLELEQRYGEEFGRRLELLGDLRAQIRRLVEDPELRQRMNRELQRRFGQTGADAGPGSSFRSRLRSALEEAPTWEAFERLLREE